MGIERRHFSRVKFDSKVNLLKEGRSTKAHLLDISLKGALVHVDQPINLKKGDNCHIDIQLSQSDVVLQVEATLVFHKEEEYGFQFGDIGLESMIHLRRLVELNVGDSDKIKEELFFLTTK